MWSKNRIYPGLFLNKYVISELTYYPFALLSTPHSVHGEYRLSPMEMLPLAEGSDARIGGEDMHAYMTAFASKFLEGRIQYGLDVRRIRRKQTGPGWELDVVHHDASVQETRFYERLVLCTGVRLHPPLAGVALIAVSRAATLVLFPSFSALLLLPQLDSVAWYFTASTSARR